MSHEFYYQDLVDALHQVGIQPDDLVLVHVGLDKIGLPADQSEHGRPKNV